MNRPKRKILALCPLGARALMHQAFCNVAPDTEPLPPDTGVKPATGLITFDPRRATSTPAYVVFDPAVGAMAVTRAAMLASAVASPMLSAHRNCIRCTSVSTA